MRFGCSNVNPPPNFKILPCYSLAFNSNARFICTQKPYCSVPGLEQSLSVKKKNQSFSLDEGMIGGWGGWVRSACKYVTLFRKSGLNGNCVEMHCNTLIMFVNAFSTFLKVPINPKLLFRLNKYLYNSEQNGAKIFDLGQNRNFL